MKYKSITKISVICFQIDFLKIYIINLHSIDIIASNILSNCINLFYWKMSILKLIILCSYHEFAQINLVLSIYTNQYIKGLINTIINNVIINNISNSSFRKKTITTILLIIKTIFLIDPHIFIHSIHWNWI